MRISSNSTMTDAQSKVFGAEMRRLRTDAEMSATDFATYLDVTQTHVSNIENANRKPSPQLAERIAHAFGTTVDAMLTPHSEKIAEERRAYGRKITQARVKKGLSVSCVAGALGVPTLVYKELEQGLCTIPERNITTLNALLGVGEEEKAVEVKKAEKVEQTAEDESAEICEIILKHITDLKVDKDTQRKVWHYFSKIRLEAEERRLFG